MGRRSLKISPTGTGLEKEEIEIVEICRNDYFLGEVEIP